jgi:ABC-type antimicrobial peptide transport system permease subunit
MKFQKEYYYCFIGIIAIFVVYLLPSFVNTTMLHLMVSIFSILLGGSMVILGFWGADFAFAMALKELDQSNEKGEVRGKKKRIYVPFMRNYTPLEWWNINWFMTLMGVLLVALGSVLLGIVAGVYIF